MLSLLASPSPHRSLSRHHPAVSAVIVCPHGIPYTIRYSLSPSLSLCNFQGQALPASLPSPHDNLKGPPPSVSKNCVLDVRIKILNSLGDKPKLHQLKFLKAGGEKLLIIQKVAVNWEDLALFLEFDYDVIKMIREDTNK